jgi:phosphoribosylformimino-5-aminoimidazole carboxamide ribotide isomerase
MKTRMEIIPAIDIRDGRCVGLYQGDYGQQTIFDDDPTAVALMWLSEGARWLHIVDLDGAASGEPRNIATIEEIVKVSGLPVELGGGIRREDVAEEVLSKGVNRVILGTLAVENPGLVERLCRRFGEAVIVTLDVRDGKIATHGWLKDTSVHVLEFAKDMVEVGVRRFIYTDIKRDGTLTEPDFDMASRLIAETGVPIIASGGICRMEHLAKLKELFVEGVIIGKALYTGDIDLREAMTNFGG